MPRPLPPNIEQGSMKGSLIGYCQCPACGAWHIAIDKASGWYNATRTQPKPAVIARRTLREIASALDTHHTDTVR